MATKADAATPAPASASAAASMDNSISVDSIYDQAQKDLQEDPKAKLACNLLKRSNMFEVVRDQGVADSYNYTFSDSLELQPKATSQGSSGRCWIFACLNVLRMNVMKKFKLPKEFQLSQSYLYFFDKLERCQYFLQNVLATVDEPVSGRMMAHLLAAPVQDGGQWDMLVNLVAKYGIMPQSAFPDPKCAQESRPMRGFLTNQLRTFARDLRRLAGEHGVDSAEVKAATAAMMDECRKQLVTFFGPPPKTFTWNFKDKDGKFHSIADITPQAFYREHGGLDMQKTVSLVNDPRNEYYQLYTVDKLGNVVGGQPTTYLNLPIEVLKAYTRSTLEKKLPVWFGCDMGKYKDRKYCALDTALYDYNLVFDANPDGLNKRERLEFGESLMTHAMVFVGFDRDADDNVAAWQVENSWGEKGPDSGRWIMTDDWFSEFVYQIVVNVEDLDEKAKAVLKQEANVLPAWDPMGALASL